MKPPTEKQAQYLDYISMYNKIHRVAPAEADLQSYFRVTPPTVHQMVLTLEARGYISRTPGKARSIRLLVSNAETLQSKALQSESKAT